MKLFRTTKQTGDLGEKAAAKFLKKNGWRVKARNFLTPHGELDIVCENKEYIIFVEVKTRQVRDEYRYGRPMAAVDKAKRDHLRFSANYYLRSHPTAKKQRFDVVEVYKDEVRGKFKVVEIKYIPCAFGAKG